MKIPDTAYIFICVFIGISTFIYIADDGSIISHEPVVDTEIEVSEDRFYIQRIETGSSSYIELELKHYFGPPVDIYITDQKNYSIYNDAASSGSWDTSIVALGKSETVARDITLRVETKRETAYYVIIDNSDLGRTKTKTNFTDDIFTGHIKIR